MEVGVGGPQGLGGPLGWGELVGRVVLLFDVGRGAPPPAAVEFVVLEVLLVGGRLAVVAFCLRTDAKTDAASSAISKLRSRRAFLLA